MIENLTPVMYTSKNTSHLLPCAGLGVPDAGLFVVGGFMDGVTLSVESEIKGKVNRDI